MKIIDLEDVKDKGLRVQYKMFYDVDNPFCSLTSKVDITNLLKYKKKHHLNAMIMYCIQNAGEKTEMCHYQVNDENSIKWFEHVGTIFVIYGKDGVCYYPNVEYEKNFLEYEKKYIESAEYCYENNTSNPIDNLSPIGTTCVKDLDIQSLSKGYFRMFLNPYLVWGKMERRFFKYYVNISFSFHHSIFAGKDLSEFFKHLQQEIKNFKINKTKKF